VSQPANTVVDLDAIRARLKRRHGRVEYRRLHACLISVLGGRCAQCRARRRLEVDHVDGATWSRRALNSRARTLRYFNELNRGVRLRVLCRSCNAIDGNRRKREKNMKEETITIKLGPADATKPLEIRAFVCGEWAAHENHNEEPDGDIAWGVSHVPSGLHVSPYTTKEKAIAIANRLDARGFSACDNGTPPPGMKRAIRAEIDAVINA
jgi:hypothetical protein